MYKSINVIHHINKRNVKHHRIISIDAEKAFGKAQHPLMIKTLTQVRIEGTYLNISKVVYDKPTTNLTFKWRRAESLPTKISNKMRMPTLPTVSNIVLEVLA